VCSTIKGSPYYYQRGTFLFMQRPFWGSNDPNLCRNATKCTNNHEYKDAVEITLHFINIKELKFVYRHNRNKLPKALVAYL
jgi:hypothetical protein